MTSQKFLFIVLLNMILLGMTVPGIARDDGALNQIHRANEHYANSQYEEASGLYQELVDRGIKNGYLFYNLGNAYLRLGEIGPAILNYVRAKQFLPRDEALTANLNHTLLKTEDQLHPPSIKGWSSIFFWVGQFQSIRAPGRFGGHQRAFLDGSGLLDRPENGILESGPDRDDDNSYSHCHIIWG